jgi:outer membrane receptor protein involved in Fe transport
LESEIDVQSVELLPGASSALYGANAFNGILFMTSQSPFTSQITAYAKFGNKSKSCWKQTTMLIMELEWRMRLVQN